MSKQTKRKEQSSNRMNSAAGQTPVIKETSSLVASTAATVVEPEKGKFPIWPEWNEADINAEKWEGAKGTKDRDKSGKSPSLNFFEDPEGKIELPPSVKIHSWKRPSEFLTMSDKAPVIVENECWFDFVSANEHLVGSELLRLIISEINIVWKICNGNLPSEKTGVTDPSLLSWKPWEHIYAHCKAGKGQIPLYNIFGKYVVKLFWMGCWRKITVDDTVPFDEENNMLLPATTCRTELWPLLLSKAILKLANVDVNTCGKRELGEFTALHSLTGWLPEVIPLQVGYLDKVWNLLKDIVPKFQFQDQESSETKSPSTDSKLKDSRANEVKSETPPANKTSEKYSKDAGKKKGKDVEKKLHSARPSSEAQNPLHHSVCESAVPQIPQMVVCASYLPLHLSEKKISILGQMADSSETLRHYGLSHAYSHPVLVTRTRSCPLVAPPKPPPIPRWKLIRPKRRTNPTDEPKEPVIVKPDQFVEIASPFLNYRLNPIHITSEHELHPPSVGKELGSPSLTSFTETDHESDNNIDSAKESLNPEEELDTTEVSAADRNKENAVSREHVASEALHMSEEVAVSSYVTDKSQEVVHSEKPVSRETWIDFDDFCKCFQTLLVYHKPNTYSNSFQKSDFKNVVSGKGSATSVSSSAPSAITASSPAKQQGSTAAAVTTQLQDEKCSSHYLFVDNLKPTEILISFSALVHWGDVQTKGKHEKEGQKDRCLLRPGMLVVEPFSWKCLSPRPPVLQIHTFATKATMLILPPGRHVSRFTATSPLGYHIHLSSTVPFVFGEEETVMPNLDKESNCFTEQALVIMKAIGNVINNFSDENELPQAQKEMEQAHCPPQLHSTGMIKGHFKAFNKALYCTVARALGSTITLEDIFAIRALTQDVTIGRDSKEHLSSGPGTEEPESWINREPALEETQAVTKLQAGWKGCYVRKVKQASKPGTKENVFAKKILQRIWTALEPNIEHHAVVLLRHIFRSNEKSVQLYPCFHDEWTKMCFDDYCVTYPDQPMNSWFIVFREVFHVPEDMLVVPKVSCTLPACILHVVNNDTGEEVPRVFQKVEPRVYTKNINGYTFMAEAHTGDLLLPAGKWKLLLIGSYNPLPVLGRETVNNNFSIKEVKDYFLPNDKNLICRYQVKVISDHLATVQVQTSKPDVYIKLQILDNDDEVACSTGKGHAVVPAFTFLPNERPSSPSRKGTAKQSLTMGSEKERSSSACSQSARSVEESQSQRDDETGSSTPLQMMHKYIIQATVLHKSWTLSESELAFVQVLKEAEKNDIKVHGEKREESTTPVSVETPQIDSQKPAATPPKSSGKKGREKPVEKSEKDKPSKDKEKIVPLSPSLDASKPNWTLRVVSDQNDAEAIEVKKDTERVDEIRALKQAWETAEPGRAIKAMQSRLQYINKYMKKIYPEPSAEGGKDVTAAAPDGECPATPSTLAANDHVRRVSIESFVQPPMDFTPFIRKSLPEAVLKDEFITEQQQKGKSEEIHRFRQFRELVMERREQEMQSRNISKKRQLEMYEQLQIILDEKRQRILTCREAYRSKLLEAERRVKEEAADMEISRQATLAKHSPPPKQKGKSAGKKK
ncbi:androglobin isoform X2 [Polyodon spathula]|uniref:androglobin isoform X2 n=1 Tax=Polyodon spathula TaxID=7913 RepID=UPI001B7DF276|nr:androglobin isoform X2 [Polyodon spathula]